MLLRNVLQDKPEDILAGLRQLGKETPYLRVWASFMTTTEETNQMAIYTN